jgi:hypothetical protein
MPWPNGKGTPIISRFAISIATTWSNAWVGHPFAGQWRKHLLPTRHMEGRGLQIVASAPPGHPTHECDSRHTAGLRLPPPHSGLGITGNHWELQASEGEQGADVAPNRHASRGASSEPTSSLPLLMRKGWFLPHRSMSRVDRTGSARLLREFAPSGETNVHTLRR